ncbi:MAG: phytase [Acidobacteriota bacterium]|nr:MAG: phytase [Acidobacteriota bacterium]
MPRCYLGPAKGSVRRAATRAALAAMAWLTAGQLPAVVPVEQTYSNAQAIDQDDMAIWIHPHDPSLSTVIASDKYSGEIYVYDLESNRIQTLFTGKPGNVDVRYGIELGGRCIDVVAFNERREQAILVYEVDPVTRTLERVDNGEIDTGSNYGFTLYRHRDGSLFGMTGPELAQFPQMQYRLTDDGTGRVMGTRTGWEFHRTIIEGMVGDDETDYVYLSEEDVGIWKVHVFDDADRTLIAEVGDASGLTADVEGITIYYAGAGEGYIIASSQGASRFTILDRQPPHSPAGEFAIEAVSSTDGVDVSNLSLSSAFPEGILVAHNGSAPYALSAVRWEDVAVEAGGLLIDTDSYDPRVRCGPYLSVTTAQLIWTPGPQARAYDVVRGDLGLLRGSAGDFTSAVEECLADDHAFTSLDWSESPAPGQGHWFLVRRVLIDGVGTYDSLYPSQTGTRDSELDGSPLSCPVSTSR